jgi:hypothetical protein
LVELRERDRPEDPTGQEQVESAAGAVVVGGLLAVDLCVAAPIRRHEASDRGLPADLTRGREIDLVRVALARREIQAETQRPPVELVAAALGHVGQILAVEFVQGVLRPDA